MKHIMGFLIVCSGANKDALNEAKLETPRYTSIGAAILLTAILASLSGGYAIYSSFNNLIISTLFGILWGIIIFNIDRYIVTSIDKNSSVYRQVSMAIPRLLISFLLAITISKPLELRIFQGSINNKLYEHDQAELNKHDSIISAKKKSLKKDLIKAQQNNTVDFILSDYINDRKNILKQQNTVLWNIKHSDAVGENILNGRLREINKQLYSIDSLISSRKNGVYSEIIETEKLNTEVKRRTYKELFATDSLNASQMKEIKDKQTNRDMLVRLKSLSDLKSSDDTMNMIGNLITLLFILIEMSPVLIKLMSKKGLYESVILTKQNKFYLDQKQIIEKDKENHVRSINLDNELWRLHEIMVLTKQNEFYLNQKESIEKDKENHRRVIDLDNKLWAIMSNAEKTKIESDVASSKSSNDYLIKKKAHLSKIKADKWYNEEVYKLKKVASKVSKLKKRSS